MKVLAVLLLCAVAAVQGRSAGAQTSTALAALGENPWVVHLRIAVSTSGLLNSCAGSQIDSRWVLTAAICVIDARFIWTRYGVVFVINPSMVTETIVNPDFVSNTIKSNPELGVALISINRHVEPTANIAPVALASDVAEDGSLCGFGENEVGGPGESLRCFDVTLATQDDGTALGSSEDGVATRFDLGAPLVKDGVQFAVLIAVGDDSNAGIFRPVADLLDWIDSESGLSLSPGAVDPEESLLVKFVN